MDQSTTLSDILVERGKKYGDYQVSMRAAALTLESLLMMHFQKPLPGPIPPHVVAHFMVGIKLNRACAPFEFNQDNYDDAYNYLGIAKNTDERVNPQLPGIEWDKEVSR